LVDLFVSVTGSIWGQI